MLIWLARITLSPLEYSGFACNFGQINTLLSTTSYGSTPPSTQLLCEYKKAQITDDLHYNHQCDCFLFCLGFCCFVLFFLSNMIYFALTHYPDKNLNHFLNTLPSGETYVSFSFRVPISPECQALSRFAPHLSEGFRFMKDKIL